MKKKIISTFLLIILVVTHLLAQDDVDALRYSMLNPGSTARSLGMGNSFGALGADFSVLSSNPGGIGMYRRSEFSFSPSFSNTTTSSTYIGQKGSDSYFKFAFGNFGAVWTSKKNYDESDWKNWTFGIGYNKTNDFSGRSIARAVNSRNSLIDNYLQSANGTAYTDFPTQYPFDINLAWETYLIDTIAGAGSTATYQSAIPKNKDKIQTRTTETKGGQGEWDFSLGTNYRDQLFLGVTLGLTTIHYESKSVWEENDNTNVISGFSYYKLFEDLKTTGAGFNLKLGAIYKPNDIIRFGIALHTATVNVLTDNYGSSIRSDIENGLIYEASSQPSSFDYTSSSPFRVISSVGVIIAGTAAVNFDYTYLDYSRMRMHASDKQYENYFTPINEDIKNKYTGAHEFRLGAELKNDNIRFRAGVEYCTSPFKNSYRSTMDYNQSKLCLSAGFGIRQEKYYIDFALSHTETGSYYQPYVLNDESTNAIYYKKNDLRFLTTIGFMF